MTFETADLDIKSNGSKIAILEAKVAAIEAKIGVVPEPEINVYQMRVSGALTGSVAYVGIDETYIAPGNHVELYVDGKKRGDSQQYDGSTPVDIYVNAFPVDGSLLDLEVHILDDDVIVSTYHAQTTAASSDESTSSISITNQPQWINQVDFLSTAEYTFEFNDPSASTGDQHVLQVKYDGDQDFVTKTSAVDVVVGQNTLLTVTDFALDNTAIEIRLRRIHADLSIPQDTVWAVSLIGVTFLNIGGKFTSSGPVLTVDGSDSMLGYRFDVRYQSVSENLSPNDSAWTDGFASEIPTEFPHTFSPLSNVPTDGRDVYVGLYGLPPEGPAVFTLLQVGTFEAHTAVVTDPPDPTDPPSADSLVISSRLTRKFRISNIPQSLKDSVGAKSHDPNNITWRRPNGTYPALTFQMGAVNETASTAAQLESRIANVSPDNGRITVTTGVAGATIPASVTGTPGKYRIIDGQGAQIGTGGRTTVKGNNVAFTNMTAGTILVLEGEDNLAIGLNGVSIEFFAPNGSPHPKNNKMIGCTMTTDNGPLRAGAKISTSAGGDVPNGQDTVISRCTFIGYAENSINGVAPNPYYPKQRGPSRTIVHECEFLNCGEEIITAKDDRFFIYGGMAHGGTGHISLRQCDNSAVINYMHFQRRGFWLQPFGEDNAIVGNIVFSDHDYYPIRSVTPASINYGAFISYGGRPPANCLFADNMFFSDDGSDITASIRIAQYSGQDKYDLWLANQEGLDSVGNTAENNAFIGPSATVPPYVDSTDNGRFAESRWNAQNPNALAASSGVALQQDSGDPLIANGAFTRSPRTITNFWPGEDLVIPVNPRLLDGSIFDYV